MNSILSLTGVSKSFDATEIIRSVDLDIIEGERHAIIGPNGAGKSTLYNLITGRYSVSQGSIRLRGRELAGLQPFEINRLGLARSFQVTNIFSNLTVFENIRCALLWSMQYRYSFWHLVRKQKQLNEESEQVLQQIGLGARKDMLAGVLTYAEQRSLELGITIAGGADVILLDEPVAGMSHTEADQSVELIKRISEGKTLVVVEHDMGVVFNLADRISVLVYGEIIATGVPEEIRNDIKVQEAYLGSLDEQDA
ncbi:MAG: ABC transporter ATP-binding protein [Pseudomonadales bacterium]|nr:ABC transporter ATP-binding protein [Pseudomonadales bacterium]MDP7357119.1 ABC transporter ATP-binding protein [Pseudomonadales bacterium]MDP7594232.1 ABC transporter ATP-binding protein [Pseudomonadales bacterium]HJN51479.1 ABC transporter ATP-binding protein [Pseudomonadales bacterium]